MEEAGELECERQRGIVPARLDGVDGLAGDAELLGEVRLRPATLRAEDAERISQDRAGTAGTPEPWRLR